MYFRLFISFVPAIKTASSGLCDKQSFFIQAERSIVLFPTRPSELIIMLSCLRQSNEVGLGFDRGNNNGKDTIVVKKISSPHYT